MDSRSCVVCGRVLGWWGLDACPTCMDLERAGAAQSEADLRLEASREVQARNERWEMLSRIRSRDASYLDDLETDGEIELLAWAAGDREWLLEEVDRLQEEVLRATQENGRSFTAQQEDRKVYVGALLILLVPWAVGVLAVLTVWWGGWL